MTKALRVAIFVGLLFLMLEVLLGFCDTTRSNVRLKLHELYNTKEKEIDLVFVGASHVLSGFSTQVFEEASGKSAFNIGSSGQQTITGYYFLKEVFREHEAKTVAFSILPQKFLGNAISSVRDKTIVLDFMEPSPNSFEFCQMTLGYPLFLRSFMQVIENQDNIITGARNNMLFKKLSSPEYRNYQPIKKSDNIYEKGGLDRRFKEFSKNETTKTESWSFDSTRINPVRLDDLIKIIELCEKENVNLIFVSMPVHPSYLLDSRNYDEANAFFEDFAHQYDIPYFNYNMARKRHLNLQDSDFEDLKHLNGKGADKFSDSFAKLMLEYENGNDVSPLFFPTFEERIKQDKDTLQALVASVKYNKETEEIVVKARVLAAEEPKLKFWYEIRDSQGNLVFHKPYSTKSKLKWTPTFKDVYEVTTYVKNAKNKNSEAYEIKQVHKVNVKM